MAVLEYVTVAAKLDVIVDYIDADVDSRPQSRRHLWAAPEGFWIG